MRIQPDSRAVGRSSSWQVALVLFLILVGLGVSALLWWFVDSSTETAMREEGERGAPVGAAQAEAGDRVGSEAGTELASETSMSPSSAQRAERHAVTTPISPEEAPTFGSLTGQVVSADDGRGLPGALLQVVFGGEVELAEASCESGDEGHFELPLSPSAQLFVKITLAGYRTVVLPEVERERELVVRMRAASSLRGRLLDRRGNAIVAHEVQLWDRRRSRYRGPPTETASTDTDGAFVFADLDPGEYGLGASSPERPAVFLPGLLVRAGEELEHDLVLADGTRIVGRVLTRQDRRPVEGATVLALSAIDDLHEDLLEHFEREARTDAAGKFELEGIGSGRVTLELRTPWGARLEKTRLVGSLAEAFFLELVVDAPASLTGFVRGQDDQPVPGASVAVAIAREASEVEWGGEQESDSLRPRLVFCGADGGFHFEALPARERLLLVAYVGQEWPERSAFDRSLSLQAGEQRSDLVLRFGAVSNVRGQVLGSDRRPLAGVQVESDAGAKGALQEGPSTNTDAAGRFQLSLGGGERARLSFVLDGYAEERRWVRLSAGETQELQVELRPVSHLRGRVVDDEGHGVVSLNVLAELQGGGEKALRRATRSDEWGLFELEHLEPGTWRIEASGPGYEPIETLTVRLPTDAWVQLSVREELPPERAVLFGEVLDAARGEPVPGLSIDHLRGGILRLDGPRFEVFGFAPGRMSLLVTAPGMETMWVEQGLVAAGARIDLGRLEMRRATHVRVRVRNAEGDPLPKARVRLQALPVERGGWPERKKRIDFKREGKGQYSARSVPRYSWKLDVDAPGYVRHREVLRIRAGKQDLQVTLKPRN